MTKPPRWRKSYRSMELGNFRSADEQLFTNGSAVPSAVYEWIVQRISNEKMSLAQFCSFFRSIFFLKSFSFFHV